MKISTQVVHIPKDSADYPAMLHKFLVDRAPSSIWALGNVELFQQKTVAVFCSVKCPGNLILKTYDLARNLRDARTPVISGFHSPLERECLDILLRGKQPVIMCLARRLTSNRLPTKYSIPIKEGQLLMISPFGGKIKRAVTQTASIRNEIVAALAEKIFVSHAATGSKTETLCRKVAEWRKPLLTFDSKENGHLFALGAKPFDCTATSVVTVSPHVA